MLGAAVAPVGIAVAPVGSASGAGSARITNNLAALSSWHLALDFGAGQELTQGWTAAWFRSGTTVTAAGESNNGSPGTGARVSAGFVASRSGSTPYRRRSGLLGVNRSGGELGCVHGNGTGDGPIDDAFVKAIAARGT
ncbi:cellulose binding domain-containing protein [Streptomyces turgidiscabies]|uniref:cellulose binding domain-containing protein n=1 Tax=Streptomyces turgidiscabies TaxID=85558 RepID=UPI004038B610